MPQPTKLEEEIAAGRFPNANERPCYYAGEGNCSSETATKWIERTNDAKWDRCLPICNFHKKYETELHTQMNAEDDQGEDEQ